MTKMKKFLYLSIGLVLLLGCGKKESSSPNDLSKKKRTNPAIAKINKTKYSNFAVDKSGKRVPEIMAVTFTGKPIENSDLEADVHLTIPDENSELRYTWIVNDKIMEKIDQKVLPSEYFKSGDWVYCKVKIVNGPVETREISSKRTKILGTVPIVKLDPIPEVSIPGEFNYKIKAYLPGEKVPEENSDDMESEEFYSDDFPGETGLDYTLISPTDKNIFLDEKTGDISWFISKDIVSSLGDKVVIKFKVSNPQGGFVTSSITLSFKQSESDVEPKIIGSGREVE